MKEYYIGQELYCHKSDKDISHCFTVGNIYTVTHLGGRWGGSIPNAVWTNVDNSNDDKWTRDYYIDKFFTPLDTYSEEDQFYIRITGRLP